jgi:hypothetical protein
VFLALLGAALFAYCAARMAETHQAHGTDLLSNLKAMALGYRVLASERVFVAYSLNIGFISGAVFAWFAGVPIVLIDSYGVAPDEFGYLMLLGTTGAFFGYASTIWLTGKLGVNRMIVIGTAVGLCGAGIYLALPLLGVLTPLAAIAPMFVFGIGLAMTFPNAMAAAVSVRPQLAGTGAALNGLSQYGIAAITTIVVGVLPSDTHLPLACVIFAMQAAAAVASWVGWRARPTGLLRQTSPADHRRLILHAGSQQGQGVAIVRRFNPRAVISIRRSDGSAQHALVVEEPAFDDHLQSRVGRFDRRAAVLGKVDIKVSAVGRRDEIQCIADDGLANFRLRKKTGRRRWSRGRRRHRGG